MKILVQFSTGVGSAEAAVRCVEKYGLENVDLISADTMVEDEDNWRFGQEVWEWLGRPTWHRIREGRTPMQVGRDERVVPNNRMAVCSKLLKRKPLRKFMQQHYDPTQDIVALGFDWTEDHRLAASIKPWEPWTITAPLMEPPFVQKADILAAWRNRGIEPPRLYSLGFSHANCGGGCVRGGKAQWTLLHRTMPERYAEWEAEEEKTRQFLGKDISMLREMRNREIHPLTLATLRQRLEAQPSLFDDQPADEQEWGACGCFTIEDDETTPE